MKVKENISPEITLTNLSTLWFQVSGTECNLNCEHCFISCGPGVKRHSMMTRAGIKGYLEEAQRLGVKEVYLTGGEPFLNPEITGIIEDALKAADVTVLTNATLTSGQRASELKKISRGSTHKLTFRVSVESPVEEVNDRVRGKGSFKKAASGIKNLVAEGFEPIITVTDSGAGKGPDLAGLKGWLQGLGLKAPRIKTLPLIHLGRAGKNFSAYSDGEFVTEDSLKDFPLDTLQCSYARMVTSAGVYACPILIDDLGARLGGSIEEALKPFELTAHACYTCVKEGLTCSNDSSCCGVTRDEVKTFYGGAAETPQAGLCCPDIYDGVKMDHIPDEVLDVSYGCGSPVALAGVQEGETVLDLGSGGGIDCFIASRQTGPSGRVIGVDMTDEMLMKANRNKAIVTERLGYGNVEFHKGFLEDIPVEAGAVDLVTSNCVINLTVDKGPVFSEIYRILKDGGRFVISDVVASSSVPGHMKDDRDLWGACISGALTVDEFIGHAKEAGFYGVEILSNAFYKEAGGTKFYSVTFRGRKFVKGERCVYTGHEALYLGPWSSVKDDDGHEFPIGAAVEVCTDTAAKLKRPPYKGFFLVTEPGEDPGQKEEDCKPGCC